MKRMKSKPRPIARKRAEPFDIQLFEAMAKSYAAEKDPSALVFDNYRQWKGSPSHISMLNGLDELDHDDVLFPTAASLYVSRHFSVAEFAAGEEFRIFCTIGGSYKIMPRSQQHFQDHRGVRYEYIMHAPPAYRTEVIELLLKIASYPFLQDRMYFAGFVLPIGEPVVAGAEMHYLYFTYPYLDDPNVYTPAPRGQIDRENVLIQTLWVLPLYRNEAEYIRDAGAAAFEQRCYDRHSGAYDGWNFFRQPYV